MFNSHVEPQCGGKKELTNYMLKLGEHEEKGEEVLYTLDMDCIQDVRGTRSDLKAIEELLKQGRTPSEIMRSNFSYRKYEKMIRSEFIDIRMRETPLIKTDKECIWIVGESGMKISVSPVWMWDRDTVIKGNLSAMSTGNVERILNKYAEKIRPDHPGLPQKLYPHMLRRTRACGLYQNGVELELVSRILGHTFTQTTRIYASPSIEMLKKAMENNSVDVSETAEWLDDEEELARICGIR